MFMRASVFASMRDDTVASTARGQQHELLCGLDTHSNVSPWIPSPAVGILDNHGLTHGSVMEEDAVPQHMPCSATEVVAVPQHMPWSTTEVDAVP